MLRSLILTVRMHRVEVLLAVALMGLLCVSALVVWSHVTAADPGAACWQTNWDDQPDTDPGCDRRIEDFWRVRGEADPVAALGLATPFLVGLLLGVPVVGRELEMRTASLAWSLTGDRRRWLLTRLLPMLGIVLVGLCVAALLLTALSRAAYPWSYWGPGRVPDLSQLGSEGLPLVGRGIMALGISLLLGALSGRTLAAFAVAGILCFALYAAGAPLLHGKVAEQVAVWQDQCSGEYDECQEPANLRYVGPGFRDGEGPALTPSEARAIMLERCPACPEDGDQWMYENLTYMYRVAPLESYPTFELTETLATTGIGLACILLTFPVVRRRRPA